jgi:hypothetical protein
MRTPQIKRIIIVVSLLVVAGLVAWQYQLARETRASLAVEKLKLESVMSEMRALRSSTAHLSHDTEQLKRSIAEARLRASFPKGIDTPEEERRRVRILSAWLTLKNATLYRKFGFSPDQITKFESLAVTHFLRMQDIRAAAQAENIPYKDPAIVEMVKDENQQYQQYETVALGTSLSQAVQQFQRMAAIRAMTSSLAGDTYYSNTPLNADQADQITQILANNSAAYQKGNNASVSDIDMPTALTQAQGVLSDTQLAALKNLYEGEKAGDKVSSLITALMQGSSSAPQAQSLNTGK